jgi:hypothetical protein
MVWQTPLGASVKKSSSKGKKRSGFQLGDHQFQDPAVAQPLQRLSAAKRQIRGALPPMYLDGVARESTKRSPAAQMLLKGKFCGHGEPTMTVFDIVVDSEIELEVNVALDEMLSQGANPLVLVARRPKGKWVVLFRREWEENQVTLEGVRHKPLSKAEQKRFMDQPMVGQVSIGFEYPSDATSRDCVSWLTIDVLERGKRKPVCAVNAELA